MTTDQNPGPTEYARSERCYVVLGPFRSGTSLVTRLTNTLGAYAGPAHELYEPSEWNPAGYIQRPDITAFNKWLIAAAGGSDGTPGTPEAIAATAQSTDFDSLDLDWIRCPGSIVVKDPRFSFTLLAWLRHGAFADRDVRLILTDREPAGMIRSALSHYDVKHYCGNTTEGARQTLAAYSAGAEWHVDATGLPCLRVDYETLDQRPEQAVEELAEFMDISDAELVARARAVCTLGRSRADHSAEAPPDAESIGSFGRGALHRQREQRCSS